MQLSCSETTTLCRRIFAGIGTPAGVDYEIAESIVWLESRGISILENLPKFLSNTDETENYCLKMQPSESANIDMYLDDDGGFITLIPAIDNLIATSAKQEYGYSRSTIFHLKHIAMIFPLLVRRSEVNYVFSFECGNIKSLINNKYIYLNDTLEFISKVTNDAPVRIQCFVCGEKFDTSQCI